MRIVIAAGIFPPDIGGPATYAAAFADYCVSQKIEVVVICFSDTEGMDTSHGYAVHRISRGTSKSITYLRYLLTLIRLSWRSGLIYAQGPVAGGVQALIARVMTGTSYVVKVTGDYAWEQGVGRYGMDMSIDRFQQAGAIVPFPARILRSVQRIVTRHARRVIVPSQYLRTMVRGWGVARERVVVVYNAVAEPPVTHMNAHEAKRTLGITGSTVITIGRLVPWKGFAALIDLWPDILQSVPDAHLYIIGSGPEHARLAELIQGKRLAPAVILTGKKTHAELAQWYQAADAFVLNSGYEGLSHTLLEAMSYGVPCVVSSNGGNTELIQHEYSGLVFGYNQKYQIIEALTRSILNPKEALAYAEVARAWTKQHTHQQMLYATMDLLRGIAYRDRKRKGRV